MLSPAPGVKQRWYRGPAAVPHVPPHRPPLAIPGDKASFPNDASQTHFVVPSQPYFPLSVLKAAPAHPPLLFTAVSSPPFGVRTLQVRKQKGSSPN